MFAKIQNGQVVKFPYTWSDFVADNNNTNYGDNTDMLSIFPHTDVAKQGYECVAVTATNPPSIDERTQTYSEGSIELLNGIWTQTWEVTTLSAEQQSALTVNQAESVRQQRNAKLTECDWTQVADAPVDKAAWATYRQALRDVPSQSGFPWEVTWPTTP